MDNVADSGALFDFTSYDQFGQQVSKTIAREDFMHLRRDGDTDVVKLTLCFTEAGHLYELSKWYDATGEEQVWPDRMLLSKPVDAPVPVWIHDASIGDPSSGGSSSGGSSSDGPCSSGSDGGSGGGSGRRGGEGCGSSGSASNEQLELASGISPARPASGGGGKGGSQPTAPPPPQGTRVAWGILVARQQSLG